MLPAVSRVEAHFVVSASGGQRPRSDNVYHVHTIDDPVADIFFLFHQVS